MSTEALSARDLTSRLIARATVPGDAPDRAARAAQVACEHVCSELSRSLGFAGFNALFTRALAEAEVAHPLLKEIRLERRALGVMNGVSEMIQRHGAAAVAAALTSALETTITLLSRLIGIDVVVRLVGRSSPAGMKSEEEGT